MLVVGSSVGILAACWDDVVTVPDPGGPEFLTVAVPSNVL
jgi:hypothetical protein